MVTTIHIIFGCWIRKWQHHCQKEFPVDKLNSPISGQRSGLEDIKSPISGQAWGHFQALKSPIFGTDIWESFRGPAAAVILCHPSSGKLKQCHTSTPVLINCRDLVLWQELQKGLGSSIGSLPMDICFFVSEIVVESFELGHAHSVFLQRKR